MIMNRYLKVIMTMLAVFSFQMAVAQVTPVRKAAVKGGDYVAAAGIRSAAAVDGEWKSLGMGKYRDDILTTLYIVDKYEFDVEIQENTSTPGLYRVVSPYKNYPINPASFAGDTYMEIDATDPDKVFFRKYDTGMDWGSGEMFINSIAGDYYDQGKFEAAVKEGWCGKLKNGAITFPVNSLLIQDGSMSSDNYRTGNSAGMFRILLPDAPDLSVTISPRDGLVEQDGNKFLSVDFNLGKNLDKINVAMFDGSYKLDMYYSIINGTVETTELTGSGEHLFPYEKDGVFSFVAVPYYKGEALDPVYVTDEFSYFDTSWKSIGTATYTDGYLADNEVDLGVGVETVYVDAQESTKTPGLFRLVDPYLNFSYSNETDYDTTHRYYMEIDASDPSRVVINDMTEGCGLTINVGMMELWSRAGRALANGDSPEEVDGQNLFGKRVGNVITFPNESLLIKYRDFMDTWYWANMQGSFKLVLPEGASGIGKPVTADGADADAAVEYFTLEGVKIGAGSLKPGLYIRKQGSVSSKVMIK